MPQTRAGRWNSSAKAGSAFYLSSKCDGRKSCDDGSDEEAQVCNRGECSIGIFTNIRIFDSVSSFVRLAMLAPKNLSGLFMLNLGINV